jgi:uncharacterized repeat protein (TIGR02543 family)
MRTIVALLVLTLLLSACPVAPELFTVTFDSQAGSAVEPQVVQNGKVAIKPADPTRTDHVFQGWFTQASGGDQWNFSTPITTSLILYAQWAALPTNTVTFDSQGGSVVPQQDLESNSPALEPEDPTKAGAVFQGWFTESVDGAAWNFSTTISTPITLYAHWLYQLSYTSANGAEGTLSGVLEQQVQHGKNGSGVTAVPAEGFEFSHWSDARTDNPRTDEQVTDSLTITAYFTLKVYEVHYTASSGGSLQGNVTQQVSHGNDGTLVEAVADEGYAFAGWSDAAVPTRTRTDRNVKADMDVAAYFAALSNTLSFDTQGGSPTPDQILEWGEAPTEPAQAPTRSGYRFDDYWYADPVADIQFDFGNPIYEDTTAYAHWIKQFTVTFDSQGGNTIASLQVDDGFPVGEPSPPFKTGHEFIAWNTASDGRWAFGTDCITADTTLYAVWEPLEYQVTYRAEGVTSGSAPSPSWHEFGSEVDVQGNPGNLVREGYDFAGWNTEADGTGLTYVMHVVFPMPAHEVFLYAQWTQETRYQLAYDGNGADGGGVPSPGDYAEGTHIEVQGNIADLFKTGYYFDGGNTAADEDFGTTYKPGDTFTMQSESLNLYAVWKRQQYTVYFNFGNGEPASEVQVAHGTAVTRPSDPTYTGRTFAGWFADSGLTVPWNFSDAITTQTTLHAKWTVNKHTLSYDGNGIFGSPPADPTDYEYDQIVQVLNNTFSRAGYSFKEWNTKSDGTGAPYRPSATLSVPDGDVVLYAIWTPNDYRLSYHGNGHDGGTIPAALVTTTDATLAVAGIGDMAKTGHDFTGWNEAADGGGQHWDAGATLTMPPHALVLYAQWKVKGFTVSYDPAGGTFAGPSSISVDYGTLLTEPVKPVKDGSSFGGWGRPAGGLLWNFGSDRVYEDLYLTAQWLPDQHLVQFNSQGGSAVQAVLVDYEDPVGEPSVPDRTGYVFAGWFGTPTGGDAWDFNASVTASMTLYAHWTPQIYQVVFNATGIDPQEVVFNGLATKPTDPTDAFYQFAGWYADPLLLQAWDFSSDTVLGPTTLYAKWVVPSDSKLSVGAGDSHTVVVDSTGQLLVSGMNDSGQLGVGTTLGSSVFSESLHTFNAVSIAAGLAHTLVVDQDGTLWVSGMNRYYGQLGAGRDPESVDSDSSVFLHATLPGNAVEVAAGLVHSLVLLDNGDLYGAGYNGLRQLVIEDTAPQESFVKIASDVVQVWAGAFNTFYKKADGSLWGAGYNRYGQLGRSTTNEFSDCAVPIVYASTNTPVRDVKQVAVGGAHLLFLLEDGRLYATGLNSSGQLGIGNKEDKTQLTFVMDGVSCVAAGDYHSAVIKSDGTVWTFGDNAYGQLGDGTTTDRLVAVQVVALGAKAFDIAAGYGHTVVMLHNMSLWGAGLNHHGQLGLGDTINRLAFTKAVDLE